MLISPSQGIVIIHQLTKTRIISLPTLRDWEQRRVRPDQAARTLLRVIEQNPEAVENALKIA